MTEHRTITIEVFRTPQGEPTCSAAAGKQDCEYLTSRKYGLVAVCLFGWVDLDRRGADGTGYLIPSKACPLWHGEKT